MTEASEPGAARVPEPGTARAPGDGRQTRARILAAGQAVFAARGYSGARVSEIVERAGTTKPMIYYHFGSKEGLFAAVLEAVYGGMRQCEQEAEEAGLPAGEAMRRLAGATFDYHAANPDWVRLISVENIHDAQHIVGSASVTALNSAVVEVLGRVLARGVAAGVFRAGVDPLHLHLLIASFCFYRVSNRHTWRVIFGRDLGSAAEAEAQRRLVVEAVERYLAA